VGHQGARSDDSAGPAVWHTKYSKKKLEFHLASIFFVPAEHRALPGGPCPWLHHQPPSRDGVHGQMAGPDEKTKETWKYLPLAWRPGDGAFVHSYMKFIKYILIDKSEGLRQQ
jgi:hypothetical protein